MLSFKANKKQTNSSCSCAFSFDSIFMNIDEILKYCFQSLLLLKDLILAFDKHHKIDVIFYIFNSFHINITNTKN